MKKRFCVALTVISTVFMNIFPAYGENDSSAAAMISQVEAIDYVLYSGAILFLLGMIFILLALFLKQTTAPPINDDEDNIHIEASSPSSLEEDECDEIDEEEFVDDDYRNSDEQDFDGSVCEPQLYSEDDDIAEDEQIVAELSENKDNATDEAAVILDETEPDEPEPELPSVRITFTGINNSDLKILDFTLSATIGRKSTNDLMISDNAVSGTHCKLYIEDDTVYVEDLDSTNGTFLNDTAISKEVLKSDDILTLGKTKYRISIS